MESRDEGKGFGSNGGSGVISGGQSGPATTRDRNNLLNA